MCARFHWYIQQTVNQINSILTLNLEMLIQSVCKDKFKLKWIDDTRYIQK